jgi:hypothetical protein
LATVITVDKSRLQKVEEGLLLIISHFDPNEPLWPRKISTHKTGRSQIIVYSIEEALKKFQESDFLDCYISAYPIYTDEYIQRTGIMFVPTLSFIDLDREDFETDEKFEVVLSKTLVNIKKILGTNPTVLSTGGGKHFLIPQSIIKPLEKIGDFKQFPEPSRKFLQFEEWLMTDGKADQFHNRTVSFRNCMLRIPGSLNANPDNGLVKFDKGQIVEILPEAEVRVIQSWDGNRPPADHLLPRCYNWLKSIEIRDMQRRIERDKMFRGKKWKVINETMTFPWIEKLLEKPIDNYRYFCVWRILVPYLINIRKLSRQDAYNIIWTWLDKCNSVKKLNFSQKKVDWSIDHPGKFPPIAWYNLERENKLLFQKLREDGVIY